MAAAKAEIASDDDAIGDDMPAAENGVSCAIEETTEGQPAAGDGPIKITAQTIAANDAANAMDDEPPAKPAISEALANLDPETARQLKLLRRLNPGMPEEELLKKVRSSGKSNDGGRGGKAKKKRWFGR